MNRHTPTIRRETVAGSPILVHDPPNSKQSIAAVIENRSTSSVRLIFTDTGTQPDPEAYISLAPGSALEANPNHQVWAYTPSGVAAEVVVIMGIRYIGAVNESSGDGASAAADQLVEMRTEKELLAEMVVLNRVMLRYFAEWQGDEFDKSDALEL